MTLAERKPHIVVAGRHLLLTREPPCDGAPPAIERGKVRCVECGLDLTESTWSAYANFFRCSGCGHLYPLRFRTVLS